MGELSKIAEARVKESERHKLRQEAVCALQKLNGYTEKPNSCRTCLHFEADASTDNFGPGDVCIRNLDFGFRVTPTACCQKWQGKK
jgi:hypothetical protein